MNRLGLLGLVACVLAACSHPQPQPPVSPLPAEPAEPVGKTAPPPVPVPPEPPKLAAHDTAIDAPTTAVKLVSPGKGKRVVAKIAPAAGARTAVELRVDFTATQNGQTQPTPTLILRADAETVSADKDGAQYKLTVTGTDTRYASGVAKVPQLEAGLAGTVGMTLSGSVAGTGAAGKLALHHDAATPVSGELMELFKVTWMPLWPALPTEAIAPGAKWQAVSTFKLAGQIDVTETVDYELVAYKDKTWTIKGVAKLAGKEQTLEGAPVSDISGTGTLDATLIDGALLPTTHGKLSAKFNVTPPGQQKLEFALVLGNDVGAVGGQTSGAALATPTK